MTRSQSQSPLRAVGRSASPAGASGPPARRAGGRPPTTPSVGADTRPPELRAPTAEDARDVVALVRRVPELDANSPYAYLLLCHHFGATGLVWREAGELRAFVLGYRPPATPDVYFLWQVGVAPESRGQGLAGRSVIALLRRLEPEGVRFLEATVTPSNEASAALFRGVARRLEAPCEERPLFGRELFPAGDGHEEEILFRIGPWPPSPTPENRSEDRTR